MSPNNYNYNSWFLKINIKVHVISIHVDSEICWDFKMPRSLKEKVTVVVHEISKTRSQNDTLEENELLEKNHNQGYATGLYSIGKENAENHHPPTPLEEKDSSSQEQVTLSSYTCDGYAAGISSAAENDESEKLSEISPQVNLLEKTRAWKDLQLKLMQYKILRQYYLEMERHGKDINWCMKIGNNKLQRFKDFPWYCTLEGEYPNSGDSKKAREGDLGTNKECPAKVLRISSDGPILSPINHDLDCNIKSLCLYFSYKTEYFIDEEVSPDLFLFIPFSKGKFKERVDYKYNILQETRKILILKLIEGMRLSMETFPLGREAQEEYEFKSIQKVRRWKHNVLNNFLEDLVRPYEKYAVKARGGNENDSAQNPRKHANLEVHHNKSKYLLLKAEYRNMIKTLKRKSFERSHEVLINDAKRRGFYTSYESFLEIMRNKGKFHTLCEDDELLEESNSGTGEESPERTLEEVIDGDVESSYYKEYLSYLFYLSVKDSKKLKSKKKRKLNRESKESKVKLEAKGERKYSEQETRKPERKKRKKLNPKAYGEPKIIDNRNSKHGTEEQKEQ